MMKRIVLQHTTGRLGGLYRIMGCEDEAPKPLPALCPNVDMLTHFADTALVATKRTYHLYRELPKAVDNQTCNPGWV